MSQWRIGSRGSDLALWQSRTVLATLRGAGGGAGYLAIGHHGDHHAR